MKMFKKLLFSAFFSLTLASMAQDNQPLLTLHDLIPGGNSFAKYRVPFPKQPQFWGDKPIYTKGDTIWTFPTKKADESRVVVILKDINDALTAKGFKPIKSLTSATFPYGDQQVVTITTPDGIFSYNFASHQLETRYNLPKGAKDLSFSKEGQTYAYTQDNNLYIIGADSDEVAITSDQDQGIVNGQAVHRNEFGINKGIFWSPSGDKLAFYRMDETMVTDYPLVDISARTAKLKNIKYPMAGMKSHHVTLGVYNRNNGQTTFLKTGTPKEKYLTNIAWSPDDKYIYVAELNRGQDTCQLVRYDALSGKRDAVLFTETHPKYVEPENPVLFLKKNKEAFIWQSKRDGHNHLYLYDTSGRLRKQITAGEWDVLEVLGFDASGKHLFYVSTEASPIEKHIYKINIENGKRTRLSKEEGVHYATLGESGKHLIDLYTSQHNPGKMLITNTENSESITLFTGENPYKEIELPEITLGTLKANDGKTDLHYRMIKPLNFDPNKKYPVIVYVYGGPHSQLVDNSWMAQARGWDIYMAEKGYLVFTLDNRGTSNRGRDFENITHRRLGEIETEDQMTGVDFLKSLSYVDSDRIGVHGWSFGGFMTLNLMLRHPETFKVGVAGGPVTDWKYYEIMYGERYMDSPKENTEGYSSTNMVDRAGDLKGRLMIIHGDEDPTVVMQHSLQFLKSAINKGTHPDFFVYPGHGHNMIGKDRVHLHEHITRYFDDFLK